MNDDDIYAFTAPAQRRDATPAPPVAAARRWWRPRLGFVLLLMAALVLALAVAATLGLLHHGADGAGWALVIDDERFYLGPADFGAEAGAFGGLLAFSMAFGVALLGVLVALMVLGFVVPLVLGIVLTVLAALGAALGLALLVALGALALVTSPVWIVVLVVWLALRASRRDRRMTAA